MKAGTSVAVPQRTKVYPVNKKELSLFDFCDVRAVVELMVTTTEKGKDITFGQLFELVERKFHTGNFHEDSENDFFETFMGHSLSERKSITQVAVGYLIERTFVYTNVKRLSVYESEDSDALKIDPILFVARVQKQTSVDHT